MARSESIKKPKLTGECRKCTQKDSPYARCIGSTIFRRVSACNLSLHIIISCYMALFESIDKPKLTGECRKCTEQDSSYARGTGSTIFRRVSACNLFLHIIISWYMALFESIEMPKLAEKGRKCTEKDSSYARCTGSTIFRRVSACKLFLHIIISCYMARTESIKKPKLTGECRKCTEQDSPHARCIGSTIFRRVSACNLFLHIIISCT
jgi:ribosomal protein L40E